MFLFRKGVVADWIGHRWNSVCSAVRADPSYAERSGLSLLPLTFNSNYEDEGSLDQLHSAEDMV
jgi:hypothetical protein